MEATSDRWFIRIVYRRCSVPLFLSACFSLCLVLAWFSRLGLNDADRFFSADCLYLPSLYKDLFLDGYTLKGWELNPAPNFFPDMILYFVLMALSGHSLIVASFLFSFIQFSLMVFLLLRIFRRLLPGFSAHWQSIIVLLSGCFILEYLFLTREFFYSFYILSNAFHTGSFVMALLSLLLSLRYLREPSPTLWWLMLLIGSLCVLSDRIFLVLYTTPAAVAVLSLAGRRQLSHLLRFAAVLVLSATLGLLALWWLSQGDYFMIDRPHKLMAFDEMQASLEIFCRQMRFYLSEFGFKSLTIVLSLLSFIGLIWLFFKLKQSTWEFRYYLAFSTLFSLLVISAPILNGSYTGYDVLRYNIFPFFLMPLNLVIVMAVALRQTRKPFARPTVSAFCVVLVLFAVSRIDTIGLYRFFHYYPEQARVLDTLTEKYPLKCGISNYWDAKPVTMFSRKGLRLHAVYPDLGFQGHVANQSWFCDNTFNYLFLNPPLDTATCQKAFGKLRIAAAGEAYVFVGTPDFTFPRGGVKPLLLDSLKAMR